MTNVRKIVAPLLGLFLMIGLALNFNACTSQSPLGLSEIEENSNPIEPIEGPGDWPPMDQENYDDDGE